MNISDLTTAPINSLTLLKRDRTALLLHDVSGALAVEGDLSTELYGVADNGDALIPMRIKPKPWSSARATYRAQTVLIRDHFPGTQYLLVVTSGDEEGEQTLILRDDNGEVTLPVRVLEPVRRNRLATFFGTHQAWSMSQSLFPFHGLKGWSDGGPVIEMYHEDMARWGIGAYQPHWGLQLQEGQIWASTMAQFWDPQTDVFEPPPEVTELLQRFLAGENAPLLAAFIQNIGRTIYGNPSRFRLDGYNLDDPGWSDAARRFYAAIVAWGERNGFADKLWIHIDEPPINYRQLCEEQLPECWELDEDIGAEAKRVVRIIEAARSAGLRVGPTTTGGVSRKLFLDAANPNQLWFVGDPRYQQYWYHYNVERDKPTMEEERHGVYHVLFDGYNLDGSTLDVLQLGFTTWAANLNSLLYWACLIMADEKTPNVWIKQEQQWNGRCGVAFYYPPSGAEPPIGVIGSVTPSLRVAALSEAIRIHALCVAAEEKVGRKAVEALVSGVVGPDLIWEWSNDAQAYQTVLATLLQYIEKGLPPLEEILRTAAQQAQCIYLNPEAALQKAIFRDNYVPTSNEFDLEYEGEKYIAQRAEHLVKGEPRVYYVKVPEWGNVQWVPAIWVANDGA
ncbi:MAG: hypothetical protein GXP42_10000 [Chloroflexi bacterium]|nr:hypothetical protein [Chloroflexota bacterium]